MAAPGAAAAAAVTARPAAERRPMVGDIVTAARAVLGNRPHARGVVVAVQGDRCRVVWENGRVNWLSGLSQDLFAVEWTGIRDSELSAYRATSDGQLIEDWRLGLFRHALGVHP